MTRHRSLKINTVIDRLHEFGCGGKIGNITCADDVTFLSNDADDLQILINTAVNYSKTERYCLQPAKSVILQIPASNRKTIKEPKMEKND